MPEEKENLDQGQDKAVQEEKAKPQEKAVTFASAEKKKEPGEKEKAKKKINRLTLKEVEKALQQVKEKMGGLSSSHAQQLLKRKEQLLQRTENREQRTEDRKQKAEETAKSGGDNAIAGAVE